MDNLESLVIKINSGITKYIPDLSLIPEENRAEKMFSFSDIARNKGIEYADALLNECIPLILELRTLVGDNASTYRENSNKVVDSAITLILIQVNGNLGFSMVNDLSRDKKNELIKQNANALSALNRVENLYKNSETQNYIHSIKDKIGGSESRINPKSSCYIATLIYKDYNCLEVCLLRVYRDSVLSKTYLGRCFTNIYYKSNPFFTPILAKSIFLQKLIKIFIDYFIKNQLNHSIGKSIIK